VVEGTVENSILSRDVRIAKGATVKNCIIFSNVKIAEGAHLENCLIDKYSIIQRDVEFHGDPMKYAYLKQGTIL
jgi:glucose-1-phosphate adenylyltransferase